MSGSDAVKKIVSEKINHAKEKAVGWSAGYTGVIGASMNESSKYRLETALVAVAAATVEAVVEVGERETAKGW